MVPTEVATSLDNSAGTTILSTGMTAIFPTIPEGTAIDIS